MSDDPARPFRVAFVPGVTPDRWVRRWRERHPDDALELVPVEEDRQRAVLDEHAADMAFVRLPVDADGLHLVRLYDEVPVVVVPREHLVTAVEEVELADLAEEHLLLPYGEVPAAPGVPAMTAAQAVETVAAGTGVVVLPMSVARLHHRRDVEHRPVSDLPTTTVGLAWPRTTDDPRAERFLGIVRGRTANSSRGEQPAPAKKPAKRPAPARTTPPRRGRPRRRP